MHYETTVQVANVNLNIFINSASEQSWPEFLVWILLVKDGEFTW